MNGRLVSKIKIYGLRVYRRIAQATRLDLFMFPRGPEEFIKVPGGPHGLYSVTKRI